MVSVAIIPLIVAMLAGLGWQRRKLRLMAACRTALRPQAERIAIEKRWLERWARSRSDFARRWDAELRALYQASVPRRRRIGFGIADFERALDAELAGLTNREIASWTFADRAGRTQEGFERIVQAGLQDFGWSVGARLGHAQRVLSRGQKRLAVRFHFDETDAACLDVEGIARHARQAGCEAACIITNGRTRGAAQVFAETFDVALLHCSQLDLLDGLRAVPVPFEAQAFAAAA